MCVQNPFYCSLQYELIVEFDLFIDLSVCIRQALWKATQAFLDASVGIKSF